MPRAKSKAKRRRSCVVIGAGLAGLAAAFKLVKAGWRVRVFEAQGRPGGRVLSHPFTLPDGTTLTGELGAEWIGKSHKRIRALCKELRLATEPHQYSTTFWIDEGRDKRVCGPEAPTLPGRVERIGLGKKQLRQRELEDGTDFGESIRMSSAYVGAMEYAYSSDSDELDYKITGGNDQRPFDRFPRSMVG